VLFIVFVSLIFKLMPHCFRALALSFFLILVFQNSKAQGLALGLYETKLSDDEMDHVQQSLALQVEFYNLLFGDTIRENIKAKVFGKRSEFNKYAKENTNVKDVRNMGGYYSPSMKEVVIFKYEKSKFFKSTYSHETSHAIYNMKCDRSELWVNEGLAEFFGSLIFENGQVQSEVTSKIIGDIYSTVRSADKLESFLSSKKKKEHKVMSSRNYNLSWALVNFLYFNNLEAFSSIIKGMCSDSDSMKAIEQGYPGGFKSFHKDIKAYYKSLRYSK